MNTSVSPPPAYFTEGPPFRVRSHTARTRSLFTRVDTEHAEQALLSALEQLPVGGLLVVDLEGVRIASEAARQLLRRPLLRLTTGELADRYLVLRELGESIYNVEVMLQRESLVAVERSESEGPQLRGNVDVAVRATYELLTNVPTATASAVQESLQLANISTATNRLTTLAKLGLARRVEHRPVAGGGREFVYAAVR